MGSGSRLITNLLPCRTCWPCHQRNGNWQLRRCRLQSHQLRSSPQSHHTPWKSSPTSSSGALPIQRARTARRLGWRVHSLGYKKGQTAATLRGQTEAEKASSQTLIPALSLAGPQRRRPSAPPQCRWPEAVAVCGPTPQSHCASHCSNVSTTKSNCEMQPARSSLISFLLVYSSCRQT